MRAVYGIVRVSCASVCVRAGSVSTRSAVTVLAVRFGRPGRRRPATSLGHPGDSDDATARPAVPSQRPAKPQPAPGA